MVRAATSRASAGAGKRPLESVLPREERDRIRAEVLSHTPRWYHPTVHLAVPSVFALGVIGFALSQLRAPTWLELLVVPVSWVLTNLHEWTIHRDLLHHRNPLAKVLYDRHTPEHHRIYVTGDMAMRDRREFHLVLIPAYGLFLIFATLLPIVGILGWLLGRNVALLYLATTMFYAASYEWLHLSYHLPPESFVGRLGFVRRLRRHHAIHHDPRLMQRWNFNVTIPFGDWLRGTIVRDHPDLAES